MNFHDYLNRQKTEDRRAFIIHFPARSGKSAFAARIESTREDAKLIDFQQYWATNKSLPGPGKFGFRELRDYLLSLDVSESVVVIDNPDVLLNTWRKKDWQEFVNWLRFQLRSPGDTDKTFIFILQDDPGFLGAKLSNSYGQSRLLALNQFEAL